MFTPSAQENATDQRIAEFKKVNKNTTPPVTPGAPNELQGICPTLLAPGAEDPHVAPPPDLRNTYLFATTTASRFMTISYGAKDLSQTSQDMDGPVRSPFP